MANRHLRALSRARRERQRTAPRQPLKLSASRQLAVIEALIEESDLLGRGDPSGRQVEAALRIAEDRL